MTERIFSIPNQQLLKIPRLHSMDFETALTQELKPHAGKGVTLSIFDYVEQSVIESALKLPAKKEANKTTFLNQLN
ncbi:hypothetical protein FD724_37170 (plasmid) [Nostoc sp. C057]|uniref:hypothetical protein n=1 Tax=Nostoc sp. C057 TaxID=2576903 RepID=UPI0015C2C8ED|nr:hypothetical protein [Nostoc sp. C057]QLE53519.1 hypothetical protein FD724_37170 [Nostoc sp. C057]